MMCGASSATFGTVDHRHTKHVRTGLAGARRMQVLYFSSIDEKGLVV